MKFRNSGLSLLMTRQSDHRQPTLRYLPAAETTTGVVLLAAFVLVAAATSFLCDDAFITFRYSINLAEGYGAVFNVGERVEGYTNFLWMLILAGLLKLGGKPETWSVVLSIACSVLTLVRFWQITSKDAAGHSRMIFLVFLALSTPFIVWSSGGLETALFTLLLFIAVTSALDSLSESRPSSLVLGAIALAAASLTRPEGVILFPILLVALVVTHRTRSQLSQPLIWYALPYLVIMGLFVVWRYSYYGKLLPATFYAKATGVSMIGDGLTYLGWFMIESSLWAPLLLVLMRLRRAEGKLLNLQNRTLAACCVVLIAVVVYEGGDFMAMGRYLMPLLPILYLLLHQVYTALPTPRKSRRPGLLPAAALVTFCALNGFLLYRTHQVGFMVAYDSIGAVKAYHDEWKMVGDLLRINSQPTDSIAVTAAGIIPYYSRLYTIDILGLIAPDRASYRPRPTSLRAGHGVSIRPDSLLAKKPQFILGHPRVVPDGDGTFPQATIDDAISIIYPTYYPAALKMPTGDGRQLNFWIRKDIVGRIPQPLGIME